MAKLNARDVAKYLMDCTEEEFAKVFTYFYESNYYFEEHPEKRVEDKDILKISAHECGCVVRDTIIGGMMNIAREIAIKKEEKNNNKQTSPYHKNPLDDEWDDDDDDYPYNTKDGEDYLN